MRLRGTSPPYLLLIGLIIVSSGQLLLFKPLTFHRVAAFSFLFPFPAIYSAGQGRTTVTVYSIIGKVSMISTTSPASPAASTTHHQRPHRCQQHRHQHHQQLYQRYLLFLDLSTSVKKMKRLNLSFSFIYICLRRCIFNIMILNT